MRNRLIARGVRDVATVIIDTVEALTVAGILKGVDHEEEQEDGGARRVQPRRGRATQQFQKEMWVEIPKQMQGRCSFCQSCGCMQTASKLESRIAGVSGEDRSRAMIPW